MASSGYINTPPLTDRDFEIAKGMLLLSGITSNIRDPALGVTLSPPRPDDYSFETKGPGIIAGLSLSIAIITLVTGLRLCLRLFHPRLKWGLDDSLMVAGWFMALVYPAVQIAMVVYGGAGKHIYDVSYGEYYIYKWVGMVQSPGRLGVLTAWRDG
jgi:hypothetical protein